MVENFYSQMGHSYFICIREYKAVAYIDIGRIFHNGIYLAGGGALLRGLDKRLSNKINIPFHIAENPLYCVAKGTLQALNDLSYPFLMR